MNAALDKAPYDEDQAAVHIEANLQGLWTLVGQYPDRRFFDDGHLTWVTSYPLSWPNLIYNPRLSGLDPDTYLLPLVEKIRRREAPATWVFGRVPCPPEFLARLPVYGFTPLLTRATLALDLATLNDPDLHVPGLTIRRITKPDDLSRWLPIASAAFMEGRDMGRDVFREHLLPSPALRFYLAELAGQAVGTAALFLHNGVAGLHLVGVLERFRRRGIATQVTVHALREARTLGYSMAVLKASSLGENIYRRLGFMDSFRLSLYTWEGPDHART